LDLETINNNLSSFGPASNNNPENVQNVEFNSTLENGLSDDETDMEDQGIEYVKFDDDSVLAGTNFILENVLKIDPILNKVDIEAREMKKNLIKVLESGKNIDVKDVKKLLAKNKRKMEEISRIRKYRNKKTKTSS